ncbi:MAG: DUF2301 domain-containing membrane protein [Gloeobacterales cyanobacterium]
MTRLSEPEVYQGQFGEFTITPQDRQGVIIYRSALGVAAICFALGTVAILWQGNDPLVLNMLSVLFLIFSLAMGVALVTIHIYMAWLHRLLQIFWGIGSIAALWFEFQDPQPLALTIYNQPLALFGIGFTFAALTGIFFKESFCFNRFETKFLTFLVPVLMLGHLFGLMPVLWEQVLLGIWAVLFLVFGFRKAIQAIPPDIGDKSVFTYLKNKQKDSATLINS